MPQREQSGHDGARPRDTDRTQRHAVAAPRWDSWARPAGFPSMQAALIWAARHAPDASDPIRLLARRLGVPYEVLHSTEVVQRFLHAGGVLDARRNLGRFR